MLFSSFFQICILCPEIFFPPQQVQTRFYVLSVTCKQLDGLDKRFGNIAKERLNKMYRGTDADRKFVVHYGGFIICNKVSEVPYPEDWGVYTEV